MDVAFAGHRRPDAATSTFLEAIGIVAHGSLSLAPPLGASGGRQRCTIGFATEKLAGRALHADEADASRPDHGAVRSRLHHDDCRRRLNAPVLVAEAAQADAKFVRQCAARANGLGTADRLDVAAGAPGDGPAGVVDAHQDAGEGSGGTRDRPASSSQSKPRRRRSLPARSCPSRPSAGDGRRGDGAVTTPGLRQHFSRGLGVAPARAVMAMKPYCN
jgi:hypothetical protein